MMLLSSVPIPIHIEEARIEADLSPYLIEAPVSLVVVFDHISVGAVAEGRVGGVLAVAQFEVSTFADVELQGTASCHGCIARTIATRVAQRQAARTPTVHLALLQVCVVGKPPCLDIQIPEMKGRLGGRYLPSRYWKLQGIGTVLYCGKSLTSSPDATSLSFGGYSICGGGKNGSFRCASPYTSTVEIRLYFAAFFRIELIKYLYYLYLINPSLF